jgi:hypothetical protein
MNREALAWAAGFFDGEGSTLLSTKHQVSITVGQSGDEGLAILERFNQSVGSIGKVRGPYRTRSAVHKPVYVFAVHGFERTQAIIAMLWPWLTEPKREQASSRLAAYVQHISFGYRNGVICIRGHKIVDGDRDGAGRLVRCRWCTRDDDKRRNDRNRVVPYRPRPSRRKEGAA